MSAACCKAPKPEIRRRKSLSGSVFQRQCAHCGAKVGSPIQLDRIERPGEIPLWDLRKGRRAQPTRRRRDYQKRFLKADWKRLRARVLERDNWTCRTCGEPANEVGHLSYERFGAERMEDLIAQCGECNQEERQKRITRAVLGG